jgi:hypothetical protein
VHQIKGISRSKALVSPCSRCRGASQTCWRTILNRSSGDPVTAAPRTGAPARNDGNDAAAELVIVQIECAAWWDAMPEGLRDTPTGEALRAIVELDLDAITSVEPPRGFGRD